MWSKQPYKIGEASEIWFCMVSLSVAEKNSATFYNLHGLEIFNPTYSNLWWARQQQQQQSALCVCVWICSEYGANELYAMS